MKWKLIFLLSLFGLGMAVLTISLIPTRIEPFFWLVIFLVCAVIIARNSDQKYFLNGFMVSIFNSIWITAIHLVFYDTYILNHPEMAEMNPMYASSPWSMAATGPVIGIVSGLVLGLFSMIAAKIVK